MQSATRRKHSSLSVLEHISHSKFVTNVCKLTHKSLISSQSTLDRLKIYEEILKFRFQIDAQRLATHTHLNIGFNNPKMF